MGLFKREEQRPEPARSGLDPLRREAAKAHLPEEVRAAVRSELERLDKTDPSVAEYSIGVNYLEFILSLPWLRSSPDILDLDLAQRTLDEEHYGLARVKERVLEHLASAIMCSLHQSRLMVVDDEPVARENTAYVLRKEGHEVSEAENGRKALDLLEARPDFDLVISDLKMGQVDGMQLLEEIKRRSPDTELILVTGYATVETAVEAMRKGAAHYLPKPLNLDSLRRTVNEILLSKRHVRTGKAPTLCFTGPPGTGKTSIGRGIAQAMGREFIRFSTAGLRDEAELRGHRRTYVGAMPGRILAEIRRAGTNNPVFMLDELDKIGQDFRGDPASVLLEVLDPEQNSRYLDHYLDMPFDLSRVMFITTANMAEQLPAPLLDRMEIIVFPSYTVGEKRRICLDYLVPRQLEANGLDQERVRFTPEAVDRVITDYTREAGLRNLERELGSVCRKVNRLALQKEIRLPLDLDGPGVTDLLGPARFAREAALAESLPGVTTGLVWTDHGGHIIFIEVARMKGSGHLTLTGSLGDVLQESAHTALSLVRSRAARWGIDEDFFAASDVHVHIPSGAVPKDGPSAGLTIAAAMVSMLTDRPARPDVAMSGEITLSGRVLPVSGLREKILAAQQSGVRMAVFPRGCEAELSTLDDEVKGAVELVLVDTLDQALDLVLEPPGR